MMRTSVGAAFAVALLGAAIAYAAETPSTPAPAMPIALNPQPPATLKCAVPEVLTLVKDKDVSMVWTCRRPK